MLLHIKNVILQKPSLRKQGEKEYEYKGVLELPASVIFLITKMHTKSYYNSGLRILSLRSSSTASTTSCPYHRSQNGGRAFFPPSPDF